MSLNGNIYFPEQYYQKDFSKSNIWNQASLFHEVVHVSQYEKRGQIFTWEGAYLILKNWILDFNPYVYKIDFFKKYSDYNIEQQGDIARDYFLFLKGKKKIYP